MNNNYINYIYNNYKFLSYKLLYKIIFKILVLDDCDYYILNYIGK